MGRKCAQSSGLRGFDGACTCTWVLACTCVRKTDRKHTHMPVCVILVLSRRQRPKASYRPRSGSYFSLWPGVAKLWCSKKTSWVFFAFYEVLHNYRRQMTGAVRLLFSRLSENKMWMHCKQGWVRDNGAAEPLSLRWGGSKIWVPLLESQVSAQANNWNPCLAARYYYPWPPSISLYGTGYAKVTVSRWWPTINSGHRAMYCVTFQGRRGSRGKGRRGDLATKSEWDVSLLPARRRKSAEWGEICCEICSRRPVSGTPNTRLGIWCSEVH